MQETRRNSWKKHLWDFIVRWDRAPEFPTFASWWCSLFKKHLYMWAFYHPNPARTWGVGWRGFPQVLHLISAPLPLTSGFICLVLAASSQTPFSRPNPLSIPSPPPRLFIPARIVFPLHLCLIFHHCCRCQQGSWGSSTAFLSPMLGVTSLIKDRSWLKAQMSWFQPKCIPTKVPSVPQVPPKSQWGCEHWGPGATERYLMLWRNISSLISPDLSLETIIH